MQRRLMRLWPVVLCTALLACGDKSEEEDEDDGDDTAGDTGGAPTVTAGDLTVRAGENRPDHGDLTYTLTQAITWEDEAYDGRLFLGITAGLGALSCSPNEWIYVDGPGEAALVINIGEGAEPTYGQLVYAWDTGSGSQSATSSLGASLEVDGALIAPGSAEGTPFAGRIQGYLSDFQSGDTDPNQGTYSADVVGTHCGVINSFTGGR